MNYKILGPFFLACFLFLNVILTAQNQPNYARINGTLIVELEHHLKAAGDQEIQNVLKQFPGLQLQAKITPYAPIYLLRFDPDQYVSQNLRAAVQKLPAVRHTQYNYSLQPRTEPPNDPNFDAQWSLDLIQAPEFWDYSTGGVTATGDTIVIAILDSGFDVDHEDLRDNLWINWAEANGTTNLDDDLNAYTDDIIGWNFKNNTPVHGETSHGTSVAGIIGARGNNSTGITGLNWNAKLMILTVGTVAEIISGYYYVLNKRLAYNQSNGAEGAFVVATNASLGLEKVFCDELPSWGEVYDYLGEAGVLNAGATANENWNVDQLGDMPTTCTSDYLIGVTNSDRFDEKVQEAGFGTTSIDLSAPGGPANGGAFTTSSDNTYDESFGGTSAATPHVAGSIALLYSALDTAQLLALKANPAQAALSMKAAILNSVDQLPALEGLVATGGRLNLFSALKYLHAQTEEFPVDAPYETYTTRRSLIRVFPNPIQASESLTIIYGNGDFAPINIRLYNALGQELQQYRLQPQPFEQQRLSIDIPNLQRGTYFVVVENGKSPVVEKVLVY
ncbi:MAG: S8 family peptidase [Phaeodactylibacter sp.]|nr:S8 family peptidase [Phaeodactylibacter sp.]